MMRFPSDFPAKHDTQDEGLELKLAGAWREL